MEQPLDREYFVVRAKPSHYLRCLSCKSLFLEPRPSSEETNTFYTADYQNYSKSKAPLINRLFDLLQKLSLNGFKSQFDLQCKILDYGCNQGQFLKLLSQVGYRDLHGFDVVPLEVDPQGAFTFHQDLVALSRSESRFDIIRLNHVIEHLPNPNETLRLLQKLLKPNGKIIGQMPNAAHYTSRIFGTFWGPLHFPYHLTLFSPAGLQKNSPIWNLSSSPCRPTIVPTGWAMSFENILKPLLFSKRRGRSPIYVFLLALSAPFVIFDRLLSPLISTAIIDFELTNKQEP